MVTVDSANGKSERAPTIGSDGKRRWLYPDRRMGPISKVRQRIASVLILFYLLAPFLTINDLPILRINILSGIVSFFGQAFRFHNASFSFFLFVIFALSLFLITAIRGRVWCGYACPQTVWIDWVIRPIEEFLEGKAAHRRNTDAKPLNPNVVVIKIIKHGLFLILASFLAHVFLSYFVPPEVILVWITNSPVQHWGVFLAVVLVTLCIYLDFAWFREQFCAFLCPYARFQSVMMDDKTPVVAYDFKRGEPRGKRSEKGDCIDCKLCVRVCPTGIDIRKGLQLECIQCSRCVDACNIIMKSLKRPPNLIREFSSFAYNTGGSDRIFTKLRDPKNFLLLTILLIFIGLFVYRLSTRHEVESLLSRQAGTTYSKLDDSTYANLFLLNLVNTSAKSQTISISSKTPGIDLICSGCNVPLAPFSESEFSLVIATKKISLKKAQIIIHPTGEEISVPLILPRK